MKIFFLSIVSLILNIVAGPAWAEPQVSITRTLTGYGMISGSSVLDYTLNIKNTGDETLYNLTLALVPSFISNSDSTTKVKIVSLAPREEAVTVLTLVTPLLLDQAVFAEQPLFWKGTSLDEAGNLSEFPVCSNPGGAL